MKKKIAILLAAIMTATMVPMNTFASSSNGANRVQTVKDGEVINNAFLKIQPKEGVEYGDTIVLSFENAEIDEDKVNLDDYVYVWGSEPKDANKTDWEYFDELANKYLSDNSLSVAGFDAIFGEITSEAKDAMYLPYNLIRLSKKEMEVQLFPLPDSRADENFNSLGKPSYYIPLPVVADGTGDVTVTVDANGTTISGGSSIRFATSSTKSGSTTTTVDEVLVSSDPDAIEIDTITIKESVQGTFEPGQKVQLKLNSGFDFTTMKDDDKKIRISAGTNANFKALEEKDVEYDGNTITFTMPNINSNNANGYSDKAAAIKISGLWAMADDDDNFGDIKLTISGTNANITKETIKVAEFGDYGFHLRAVEDPTTIYAGRVKTDKSNEYIRNNDVTKEMDEDDFVAATVEFSEITSKSWNTNRSLEFTVPEGVKIFDAEIDEEEDIRISAASISNDGRTLKIKGNDVHDLNADACSFELKLYLSADAAYEGDVMLSVRGAGISEGDVEDVKIAEVVAPVSVTTSTTNANMGYQKVDTADIVITEAEDGVLLKGGTVEVAIDSIYGDAELGFADEGIDYEIDGDLEIKNFKVDEGVISFKVDDSSSEASSITLKNVKIGTTRSIPLGSYGIKVGGTAVINNYSEDAIDDGDEAKDIIGGDKEDGVGFFNDTDYIKVPNYIDIKTETGTLDSVVKVTIGEKTMLVNEEAIEIDAAPYIQAESSSTMVPLRFVMVALGVDSDNVKDAQNSNKVTFDANTKTATVFYAQGSNTTIIQFTAGSNVMKVNGTAINMENGVKAEITNDRMFVPFRAIGTALGVKVSWDETTRTAIYNAK